MNYTIPNRGPGGISRSRRFWMRGGIAVLSPILGIILDWLACAQTNVSLEFAGRWQPSDGRTVNGVSVVGNYAYIGAGDTLEIIDISDPRNPSRLGGYVSDGSIYGVQVVGNHAFLG